MSLSAQVLARRIKKSLGNTFTSDAHSESEIVDYINSAVRHLSMDGLFPFLVLQHLLLI